MAEQNQNQDTFLKQLLLLGETFFVTLVSETLQKAPDLLLGTIFKHAQNQQQQQTPPAPTGPVQSQPTITE